MLFVISVLIVLIAIMLIIMYCCLVIASREERYEEEYFRNNKQETDKNEMDKEYFFRVFGSLCDEIFIENIFPIWPGFKLPDSLESDGSAGQYGQDIQEKQQME